MSGLPEFFLPVLETLYSTFHHRRYTCTALIKPDRIRPFATHFVVHSGSQACWDQYNIVSRRICHVTQKPLPQCTASDWHVMLHNTTCVPSDFPLALGLLQPGSFPAVQDVMWPVTVYMLAWPGSHFPSQAVIPGHNPQVGKWCYTHLLRVGLIEYIGT